jgi:hypothetical protein
MNRAFYLSVLFVLVIGSSVFAATDARYSKINIADYCSRPEALDGRLVEVSARVIAIHADSTSMELFDSESRTSIVVRLNQLRKSERNELISSNVRRVAVSGRASMVKGRLFIDAQSVQILPLEVSIRETATVPLVN